MRNSALEQRLLLTVSFALFVAGVGLAAASVVLDPWSHDGGYFLQRSADVASGLRPSLDYRTTVPPVVDLLTAPLILSGAHRLFLAIAIPMCWIAVNALASWLLAWRVSGSRTDATLLASLYFLYAVHNGGDHLTLEHGVTFFAMLALTLLCGTAPMTRPRLVMAGAMIAATIASKQPGAVVLIPAAAALWTRRAEIPRHGLVAFAGGFVALPLAILAWLDFAVLRILRGMSFLIPYAKVSTGFRRTLLQNIVLTTEWQLDHSVATALFWGLASATVLYLVLRRARGRLFAAVALFAFCVQIIPFLIRNHAYYNLNLWTFLVLVFAVALRDLTGASRRLLLAALMGAGGLFVLTAGPLVGRTSYLFEFLVPAARLTEAHTPPGTAVRQYGSEQMIEFLAERREQQIDKAAARIYVNWDGGGMYDDLPPPDCTVIVLDRGQDWVEPQLRELEAAGWIRTALLDQEAARLIVLRHRSVLTQRRSG